MIDDLKKLLEERTDDPPPEQTEGVRLARENRAICNNLTDEQRQELLKRAMARINHEPMDSGH